MTTTADILRAAKARIDTPEKWRKGFYIWEGRRCAAGALLESDTYEPEEMREVEAGECYRLLNAVSPLPEQMVLSYNDAAETTHADIMALYDRAIALAEAQ